MARITSHLIRLYRNRAIDLDFVRVLFIAYKMQFVAFAGLFCPHDEFCRVSLSTNKCSHSCQRRPRNGWKAHHIIAFDPPSPFPETFSLIISSTHIPWPVSRFPQARLMRDKKGPECGKRDHRNSDAGFCNLPKYLPIVIVFSMTGANAENPNRSSGYHHERETKKRTHDNLLSNSDLNMPKEIDWYKHY